jgi:hypothetical protein
MSEEKLAEFLKNGEDWGKVKTSVPGLFILKLPASKNFPARLSVEINPVDASGTPTKRRGLIIREISEFEEFKEIMSNDKIESLFDMLEEVNPPSVKKSKGRDDYIDI